MLEYELSPCSFCREYAVGMLQGLECLPEWMIEECRWDANPRTRALVLGADDSGT